VHGCLFVGNECSRRSVWRIVTVRRGNVFRYSLYVPEYARKIVKNRRRVGRIKFRFVFRSVFRNKKTFFSQSAGNGYGKNEIGRQNPFKITRTRIKTTIRYYIFGGRCRERRGTVLFHAAYECRRFRPKFRRQNIFSTIFWRIIV